MFPWESAPGPSEWLVCSSVPLHLFVSGLHEESHLLKMAIGQDAVNINIYLRCYGVFSHHRVVLGTRFREVMLPACQTALGWMISSSKLQEAATPGRGHTSPS